MKEKNTANPTDVSEPGRSKDAFARFCAAWQMFLEDDDRTSSRPKIHDYMQDCPPNECEALFWELLTADMQFRRSWGQRLPPEEYEESFRDLAGVFRRVVPAADDLADATDVTTSMVAPNPETRENAGPFDAEALPARIGRYRVRCLIDRGGFGQVYRAYDAQLDRDVAIKVPLKHRVRTPKGAEQFQKEARIIARLEHAHIVPVFDAGLLPDGRCYVVSKWIEGNNLAAIISRQRPDLATSVEIVAKIAAALQVAHRHRITHRDVKPGNILIDVSGAPYLTDFGLAISEDDEREGMVHGMTPVYASPEQARGEGHLVDGRSDVFSLGVVLYELLTGERPFRGETHEEVLAQIVAAPPKPPRHIVPEIPDELERVCLKALSKRATDRYNTAFEFAADLSRFLQANDVTQPDTRPPRVFISYRREDSLAFVGRVCERLQSQYGDESVFLDVLSLRLGLDFRRQTEDALNRCDVLLVVIGPNWEGAKSGDARRLDDADDHVRIEVEAAISRGMPIVPVLVGSTAMPAGHQLPESVKDLAFRHACQVDDGRNFDKDIQQLIEALTVLCQEQRELPNTISGPARAAKSGPVPEEAPSRIDQPTRVFPKGLRSFDEADASFFMRLLPGPTNRDGLTESISFWKSRIEDYDPYRSFRVGLVYGPSGCGKTSLIKAGLLPRLADHVIPIYVEAAAVDTEARLLHQLARCVPGLPGGDDLVATLTAVRRRRAGHDDTKVLIVLDQFEQWLHAHRAEDRTMLLHALRQCDGHRVQGLLMVKDEYWMPATRFMEELEVPLIQDQNFAAVDLFDALHARDVLVEFGLGYGRLPEDPTRISEDEKSFLDMVIADLTSQDGKIVPVQLALFAEMVKNKPWTPVTFEAVGGAKGVGVTFLKETFTGTGAPPRHRLHQRAARDVLKKLLPERGLHIKGAMQSEGVLRVASGYGERPRDFEELMRILNAETRLVTPVDPEGHAVESVDDLMEAPLDPKDRYYQLTHDYLVPSVRKWLNVENQATRSGRARICLEECAEAWKVRQDGRYLPTFWETLSILLLTDRVDWSQTQQVMMSRAGRIHGWRALLVTLTLLLTSLAWNEYSGYARAKSLVASRADQLTTIMGSLRPSILGRAHLHRLAKQKNTSSANEYSPERLHALLAVFDGQDEFVEPLVNELARAGLPYTNAGRQIIEPHRDRITPILWERFHQSFGGDAYRFHAGLLLATLDAASDRWSKEDAEFLVAQFVKSHPEDHVALAGYLRPIADRLLEPMEQVFLERESANREINAARAVSLIAPDHHGYVASLLRQSTPDQFEILYAVSSGTEEIQEDHLALLETLPGTDTEMDAAARIALGTERALAVIALCRDNERYVALLSKLFRWTDDPEAMTQFVHRCSDYGIEAKMMVQAIKNVDVRSNRDGQDQLLYGLLLAVGDLSWDQLEASDRQWLEQQLLRWYSDHPSSAVHGASGWLLRTRGFRAAADGIDRIQRDRDPSGQRDWFVDEVRLGDDASEACYLSFVEFHDVDGVTDADLAADSEQTHLGRRFAVMDREVTAKLWQAFGSSYSAAILDKQWKEDSQQAPGAIDLDYMKSSSPHRNLNWYQAVSFCRWLTTQAGYAESDQCYADPAKLSPSELTVVRGETFPKKWPFDPNRPGYRLLTSAEWVYACKSGSKTSYSFGSDPSMMTHFAWYADNSLMKEVSDIIPWPVGLLQPNRSGLFDVYGNVSEWCHDAADTPQHRIMHGGSFANTIQFLTTSKAFPEEIKHAYGLRIAKTIP